MVSKIPTYLQVKVSSKVNKQCIIPAVWTPVYLPINHHQKRWWGVINIEYGFLRSVAEQELM